MANQKKCLLLFSGGRDSTLAAIRLMKEYDELVLLTVTSGHLQGIEKVESRIKEMQRCIYKKTTWYHIRVQDDFFRRFKTFAPTCLPCHHAYISIGVDLSKKMGINNLSLGYAGYQAAWAEQTEVAVSALKEVLKNHDISLVLPVYDVTSKEDAIAELKTLGLSVDALEQKCLKQVTNIELISTKLNQEVEKWRIALDKNLSVGDMSNFETVAFLELYKDTKGGA